MEFIFEDEKNDSLLTKVEKELFEHRVIYLNEDISQYTISNIIPLIHLINAKDDDRDISVEKRQPIHLHIASYGGDAYSGWNLVSVIENSKTPVWTYVEGFAMSMALPIYLSGARRHLGRYATLLYHELRGQANGTRQEVKRLDKEYDRLQKIYDDYIVSKSLITQDILDKHQEMVNDWYIGLDDAKKYKLYDEII